MLPIVGTLVASGLSLLGNAVMAKGKEWLQEKTGVDLDQAALSSEDLTKLRQYEMEHEEELIRLRQNDDKLSAELEMAYLKDIQNARGMQEAALAQDDVFSKRFIYYFSIVWSILVAAYIGFITFGSIPADNVRFADTILGFLLGSVLAVMMQFFYGSSRTSQRKDETIASLTKGTK